jgi:antitoxin component of MazEF toxin-antitoxin module
MARPVLDKNGSTQVAVRIPNSWLKEIDALISRQVVPGLKPKRADILREVVRRGLNEMRGGR